MTATPETVHACPPGNSSLTPCCGRTPFELTRTDRLTYDPAEITCTATTQTTMTTTPSREQQLAVARARHDAAAIKHLADTATADQALIGDDASPHWQALEHAANRLAFIDVDAMCAVQDLDTQNDARGREIDRLRAALKAVNTVCDAAEHQATRWENPLPVPAWVDAIRTAAQPSSS
jgi:hypothetical protein